MSSNTHLLQAEPIQQAAQSTPPASTQPQGRSTTVLSSPDCGAKTSIWAPRKPCSDFTQFTSTLQTWWKAPTLLPFLPSHQVCPASISRSLCLAALTGSQHKQEVPKQYSTSCAFSYHKMMFKVKLHPLFIWELVWATQSSVPSPILHCDTAVPVLSCSPSPWSHPHHQPS